MDNEPSRSKTLEYTLGILILLGVIAAFFIWQDVKMRTRGKSRLLTEAMSNARQIGIALLEFDTDYGAFPCADTQVQVAANFPSSVVKGSVSGGSNGFFKQLFEAGVTQSEAIFYAKIKGSRRPDGHTSTNAKALEKGEVGFSYICGLCSAGLSPAGDPTRPIVLTPLIPGTTRFDPEPFGGKAVILHIDNTTRYHDIEKDGRVLIDGIDILSPKHPVWKGTKPDIRYPE